MVDIQTGCNCIDNNIGGGIKSDVITLIYGEPETGKSTLALQCAFNCAAQGLKVLFVDCDNTLSTKRLSQIAGDRFDEVAERIVLLKPKDFCEQTIVVDHIQDYVGKKVGLIVIDTLTSLYGARVCETSSKAFTVNRELNRQLAILAQTVKILKIPLIITSQVRSIIEEEQEAVRPVATRVLKFWADIAIVLKPTEIPQTIKAIVERKHETTPRAVCYVQIVEKGIQDTILETNG
jgi:RecA/RadA recombinase